METLAGRAFAHRFEDVFIPILSTTSVEGSEEQAAARDSVAKMKPELLPALDAALWTEWADVEKYAAYAEKPFEDLFRVFVKHEY